MNIIKSYFLDPRDCSDDGTIILNLPRDAEVLSVTSNPNSNIIYLWVDHEVTDYKNYTVERHFVLIPKDREYKNKAGRLKFISTVVTNSSSLVFHVFERVDAYY